MLKKVLIGVVGAVASAVATLWVTKLLERKSLGDRVRDARGKVVDIKDVAVNRVTKKVDTVANTTKEKLQELTDKVDTLIKDKDKDD